MVAAAALQLSVVQLRMRLQGRGQQRWAVAALDNGFIRSLIFIRKDSLLSHKSYYITSMTTPIYIFRLRCSPILFKNSPPPPHANRRLCAAFLDRPWHSLPSPSGYAGKRPWEGAPRAVVVGHAATDNGDGHSPLWPSLLTPLASPLPPWQQQWQWIAATTLPVN